MARNSVVQEYGPPQINLSTFVADGKTAQAQQREDIKRPKGYTVSWHQNPAVEPHHFGSSHPMKPWRLTLTKQIVMAYGMHHAMDLYYTRPASHEEMADFHTSDYLDFLKQAIPADMERPDKKDTLFSFNFGDDCPVFDGMYNYSSLYAGGTLDAARKLCNNQTDIAINWSGGLHHAKKSEASGFCYVNDIVLGILQLLRIHPRVMYIDIDVHHGDGVEQAFWSTDRVLTVSFHKYDRENFFPGTGGPDDTGPTHPLNPGAHYALNVPLQDGIEDNEYVNLFKSIIRPCIETFRPAAIVLQCGADSLGCDRLGCFNLNIRAHGACTSFVKSFGIPMLVVGGGGYTPRNVSRLWAYETAICVDASSDLNPSLPENLPFRNHFKPDCSLFPPLSEMRRIENKNTRAYIDEIRQNIIEQLRYMKGAPSVQMAVIPPDILGLREELDRQIQEEMGLLDEEMEDMDGAGVSTMGKTSQRRELETGHGTRGELHV